MDPRGITTNERSTFYAPYSETRNVLPTAQYYQATQSSQEQQIRRQLWLQGQGGVSGIATGNNSQLSLALYTGQAFTDCLFQHDVNQNSGYLQPRGLRQHQQNYNLSNQQQEEKYQNIYNRSVGDMQQDGHPFLLKFPPAVAHNLVLNPQYQNYERTGDMCLKGHQELQHYLKGIAPRVLYSTDQNSKIKPHLLSNNNLENQLLKGRQCSPDSSQDHFTNFSAEELNKIQNKSKTVESIQQDSMNLEDWKKFAQDFGLIGHDHSQPQPQPQPQPSTQPPAPPTIDSEINALDQIVGQPQQPSYEDMIQRQSKQPTLNTQNSSSLTPWKDPLPGTDKFLRIFELQQSRHPSPRLPTHQNQSPISNQTTLHVQQINNDNNFIIEQQLRAIQNNNLSHFLNGTNDLKNLNLNSNDQGQVGGRANMNPKSGSNMVPINMIMQKQQNQLKNMHEQSNVNATNANIQSDMLPVNVNMVAVKQNIQNNNNNNLNIQNCPSKYNYNRLPIMQQQQSSMQQQQSVMVPVNVDSQKQKNLNMQLGQKPYMVPVAVQNNQVESCLPASSNVQNAYILSKTGSNNVTVSLSDAQILPNNTTVINLNNAPMIQKKSSSSKLSPMLIPKTDFKISAQNSQGFLTCATPTPTSSITPTPTPTPGYTPTLSYTPTPTPTPGSTPASTPTSVTNHTSYQVPVMNISGNQQQQKQQLNNLQQISQQQQQQQQQLINMVSQQKVEQQNKLAKVASQKLQQQTQQVNLMKTKKKEICSKIKPQLVSDCIGLQRKKRMTKRDKQKGLIKLYQVEIQDDVLQHVAARLDSDVVCKMQKKDDCSILSRLQTAQKDKLQQEESSAQIEQQQEIFYKQILMKKSEVCYKEELKDWLTEEGCPAYNKIFKEIVGKPPYKKFGLSIENLDAQFVKTLQQSVGEKRTRQSDGCIEQQTKQRKTGRRGKRQDTKTIDDLIRGSQSSLFDVNLSSVINPDTFQNLTPNEQKILANLLPEQDQHLLLHPNKETLHEIFNQQQQLKNYMNHYKNLQKDGWLERESSTNWPQIRKTALRFHHNRKAQINSVNEGNQGDYLESVLGRQILGQVRAGKMSVLEAVIGSYVETG